MHLFVALSALALSVAGSPTTPAAAGVGLRIDNFSLRDVYGKSYSLADLNAQKGIVVVFMGVECPLAKLYAPRLEELAAKYKTQGVAFVCIDSNQQDSVTEMTAFARQHGMNIPFLKDVGNVVADQFAAERTPEVFLLDADRTVRYRGRIDDQYGFQTGVGYARPKITTSFLCSALDEVLAGKAVSAPEAKAIGCLIGRVKKPDVSAGVTYSKQISRILQKHCVECHRPGQIAPFALSSYQETAGWASMIEEVVREQRMPPWHADPRYGHWSNDRRLSDEEKSLIMAWAQAGAPEGDPKDLPPERTFVDGWQISEPDLVAWMSDKPFKLPAQGTIPYQYFTVDPGLKKDVWVKAAEARPGNRSVVHHIIVFLQPPGVKAQFQGNEPMNLELLHGTAPGMPPMVLPDGMAFHVPAGSKFIFQMHYTANGSPSEDRSSLGLVFADPKEVQKEIKTDCAINNFFVIPAGANSHRVEANHLFRSNMQLLYLMPHMHLRGKAFRYTLKYPDGREELLLDIPRYDFNWQNAYYFSTPKKVPMGSVLHCVAHFDNSDENLANPDATKPVRWGDQTWEEMMIGWYTAARDGDYDAAHPELSRTAYFVAHPGEAAKYKGRLDRSAAKALHSPADFSKFGKMVTQAMPQVDRVCAAVVESGSVRFLGVQQGPALQGVLGGADRTFAADSSELARVASLGSPVVHEKLAGVAGADVQAMGARMQSSFHVPVKQGNRTVVVSFWSREPGAFPKAAEELLEKLAQRVSTGG